MVIFISQLMKDKTDEYIMQEREKAIKAIAEMKEDGEIEGDIEIIDSFIKEYPTEDNPNIIHVPVNYLAKAIAMLSMCDAAYFCDGWDYGRGTNIEHTICEKYGIRILKD